MEPPQGNATIIRSVDPPGQNIVRVAVQLSTPDALPQHTCMLMMDQDQALTVIVKDLCGRWDLQNPEDFALQFDEKTVHPPPYYITESNRGMIQNGDILKMYHSAVKMSQMIVAGLKKGNVSLKDLDKLSTLSSDKTFADQFITEKGYSLLSAHISKEKDPSNMGRMGYALQAFVALMEHDIVSWDTLDQNFLDSVNLCVNYDHSLSTEAPVRAVKSGLEILISVIQNSSRGRDLITDLQLNSVDSFLLNLKTRDQEVQTNCIALVNAILEQSDSRSQRIISVQLHSKATRGLIWESIFTAPIGIETGYQLYSLQTRIFNLLSSRLEGAIGLKDEAAMRELRELRSVAFETNPDQPSDPSDEAKDFAKLGFKIFHTPSLRSFHPAQVMSIVTFATRAYERGDFQTPSNPLADLHEAPPGILALDCISFFSRQYPSAFKQMVLENSRERADEQDCPIAQASTELTKLLAAILAIGKPPAEQGCGAECIHYPMFFTKDRPFEEFFSICIQRFAKTWKEMKASHEDFNKVLMVVKEQILRALKNKPHTFEQLKNKLNQLSFSEIQSIRKRELEQKEENRTRAKPIRELMKKIEPEMIDLIKQQRMNMMIAGVTFKTKNRSRTEKFFFCRLTPNWKTLHYGMSQSEQVQLDTLSTVNVSEVVDVTGEQKKAMLSLTLPEKTEPLQFVANSEEEYEYWLDGFNALLGREMNSDKAKQDLEELLQMEIKLRLLDAEGINFPEEPPPIPPLPTNYNFVTA